ncbi:MAG TPA: hypothetical protein VGL40_04910 [Bacillota bacterium]
MSGEQAIIPGPCTPATPCPPITEIVCVDVDKVFDSCSNVECAEFCVPFDTVGVTITPVTPVPVPPFTFVSCTAGPATVGPITTAAVPGQPLLQRVIGTICGPASVTFTDAAAQTFTISLPATQLCFNQDVLLFMPNPSTMFGKIEVVTFACLGARVITTTTPFSVCVTIGLRAIVKSEGQVQLMLGAFGYCPVPPTCRELGSLCEGFIAAPFPTVFPPEIFEVPLTTTHTPVG